MNGVGVGDVLGFVSRARTIIWDSFSPSAVQSKEHKHNTPELVECLQTIRLSSKEQSDTRLER